MGSNDSERIDVTLNLTYGDLGDACAASIPPGTQAICPIQDFIQRRETYRAYTGNTFDLQRDQN